MLTLSEIKPTISIHLMDYVIKVVVIELLQSFVFRLKSHPIISEYWQCTTIGYFESDNKVHLSDHHVLTLGFINNKEFLYFMFVFTMTWLLPLVVMITTYVTIIIIIYKR